MRLSLLVGLSTVLLWSPSAISHGGGLDSYGCHHNRKQGGYHCHRGENAGKSYASKEDMLNVTKKRNNK